MKNKIHITRTLKRVNTFIKRPDKRTRMKEYVRKYELKSGSKINKTYKILTSTANNNYIFYRMRLNSNEALGKF